MFKNIKFHTLGGIRGWSSFQPSVVDVAKISQIYYSKRLFKIFNPEYKYSLEIIYKERYEKGKISPTITTRGIGVTFVSETHYEKLITRRFKTEEDIFSELSKIKNLQGECSVEKLMKKIERLEREKIDDNKTE